MERAKASQSEPEQRGATPANVTRNLAHVPIILVAQNSCTNCHVRFRQHTHKQSSTFKRKYVKVHSNLDN